MSLFLYFLSDPKTAHDVTGAVAEEAKIIKRHIPVESLGQIVGIAMVQSSILRQKIKHLVISGHGSRHSMRFGNDNITIDNVDNYSPVLRALKPYFDKDAIVTLFGCSAGQNKALLIKLSFILGVRVQGASEDIDVGTWGPFEYMSSSDTNTCLFYSCSEGSLNMRSAIFNHEIEQLRRR